MEKEEAEKITTEFFKRRFPNKDIKFEKTCGYFWTWVDRFMSDQPETSMDAESKRVWRKMQEEKHWTEDPEQEFECQTCGTSWKQKDGVVCPKCDSEISGMMTKEEFKKKLENLMGESNHLSTEDVKEAVEEALGW